MTMPPEIEYRFALQLEEDFGRDHLERIAQAVEAEDMLPVSPETLVGSYAAMAAFDISLSNSERIVGFARQVQRDRLAVSAEYINAVEIGTVWVDSAYRGQGIGQRLIQDSVERMSLVGFVPLAVCNQHSRNTFEALGFQPLGNMPSTKEGNERVVEMFEQPTDHFMKKEWDQGLRQEVTQAITHLPRFQGMELLEAAGVES